MNKQKALSSIYNYVHQNGWPGRLGKTFKTNRNYYFYDMGTGKVAMIKYPVYILLDKLLENCSLDELSSLNLSEEEYLNAIEDISDAIENEYILSAVPMEKVTGNSVTKLDEILDTQVESITLEITEKCNLRCKYCIYNSGHSDFRNFGVKDMSITTAKKAVDFLASHSSDVEDKFIGFYGGEPLLNFSVIREVVAYSKEKIENIGFSMTTNATLMTQEIANFLMENDFSVVVSLDGPEELHNENRLFIDGTGSFEKTIQGLKFLLYSAEKYKRFGNVSLNIVTSGMDFIDRYNKIQEFICNSDFIPHGIGITTSSADYGPYDCEYILPQSKEEKKMLNNVFDKLHKWEIEYKKSNPEKEEPLFSAAEEDKDLMLIHKRLLSIKPTELYSLNGCCVPGGRRIYITTDGEFQLCEKTGNMPSIGNINNGFYKEKIKKVYIEDFIKEMKKYCGNCWAANLCSLCYVGCYDQEGVHFEYRHDLCRGHRIYLEDCLIKYHAIMESDPQRLEIYNHRDFK